MKTYLIPLLFLVSSISFAQTKQTVQTGKVVYTQYCLSCHQEDGYGVPNLNPPLAKVDWVTGDKTRLITVVLNGLSTPLEIDGETYHNAMPAHKHLTDQQIADVLTYIRSSFGNKASAVSANEVKKVRGK